MVYFQLDYDISQEGPVGVVLFQYLTEEMIWQEAGLFTVSDNQSMVLKVVEKGVYGISIEPIDSTKLKFESIALSQS